MGGVARGRERVIAGHDEVVGPAKHSATGSANDLRDQALHRLAERLEGAALQYEGDLAELAESNTVRVRDIPRQTDEAMVRAVVFELAQALRSGSTPRAVQLLERVHAALRPPVDGRTTGVAVELAEEIVRAAAEAFLVVRPGSPHPDLPAPFTQGRVELMLALDLAHRVHPAFATLRGRPDDVRALLGRHTTTKARRARRGEPSRLTASGILVRLNALVAYPLGRLSVNSVDRVLRRLRT